ncbi:hypothetical protein JRC04_26920 [Mycolicibacterium sp. S2-37]|uniref:hypothetical protein n=1 Tax=Mycolicibacterium sp. S2-37 TaxID=2810297 RepID=UPI001A94E8CB|nr:hypothetical protein [Mycolicibacterium sp. S2-37]MBO0681114.1 hypothetical protein [Mycolicibacterium sp. S2-37]
MTLRRFSAKHSGRIALFGFALGAGVLLAGGAGVAAAAPGESGQGSGVSSSAAADPGPSSSVSRTHPTDKTRSVAPARVAKPTSGISSTRGTTSRTDREKTGAATEPSARVPQRAEAAQSVPLATRTSNDSVPATGAGVAPAQATPARSGTQLQVTTGSAVEDPQSGLASLSADLARAHSDVQTEVPATVFGNFEANKRYRHYQGPCGTCTLMSVAGVIGQLSPNHRMPDQKEIIGRASSIASDVIIGENIYEPDSDGPNPAKKHGGTAFVDAVTLLRLYDIDAEVTEYSRGQGTLAMNALKSALAEGQGVIVNIHNLTAYTGYNRTYFGSNVDHWGRSFSPIPLETWGNHAVIVLEVDDRHGMVYLNDSAPRFGQGMPIPVAAFMEAWKASRFQTITARPGAAVAPQHAVAA